MSNKIHTYLLFIATIALITFSSCGKENLDDTDIDDEVETETVVCDPIEIYFEEEGENTLAVYVEAGSEVTYLWSTESTESSITAEPATEYSIVVTDAEGCTEQASYTTLPAGVECGDITVSIAEDNNVLYSVATGGTAPYVYLWSDGSTTSEINSTPATAYALTVTDVNGCTGSTEITTIDEVPCESLTVFFFDDENGNLSTDVSGGIPPYTFEWSNGSTDSQIAYEPSTAYSITITDANGCTGSNEYTTPDVVVDCSTFQVTIGDDGAGSLQTNVSGGTAPFAYDWSNGSSSSSISNVQAGTYIVWVVDANGCAAENSFVVGVEPTDCNNSMNFVSSTGAINFDAECEAYLYRSTCDDLFSETNFDHSYIISDVSWDAWGTNSPMEYYFPLDGIPGITMGSNGVPQIGQTYPAYAQIEALFNDGGSSYITDGVTVTITETGNQAGQYIGGTISGFVADHNDPSQTTPVFGSFCVPIVSVCE